MSYDELRETEPAPGVVATVTTLHPNTCDHLDYNQMLQTTGLTPRQLDVWTRAGRLTCHHHAVNRGGRQQGSGVNRYWAPTEVTQAKTLKHLMTMGFELQKAERLLVDRSYLRWVITELQGLTDG